MTLTLLRATRPLNRTSIYSSLSTAFKTNSQIRNMSDTITKEVLDASELKEGQIKAVDVDGGKVLLSNIGGKINATSAFCTHYGAPLESKPSIPLLVDNSNP
jgi:hypothetical protein